MLRLTLARCLGAKKTVGQTRDTVNITISGGDSRREYREFLNLNSNFGVEGEVGVGFSGTHGSAIGQSEDDIDGCEVEVTTVRAARVTAVHVGNTLEAFCFQIQIQNKVLGWLAMRISGL